MPRHPPPDDDRDWLSDDESWRGGSNHDSDELDEEYGDEDESPTVECKMCGCDIYEDVVQCPLCGEYQTQRPLSAWEGRPLWWKIGGLIGIIATLIALIGIF